jgi:hypothetical protein
MKKVTLVVLVLFCIVNSSAQNVLTNDHKKIITDFINYFKNNDREEIALLVSYPLKREYPISEVKDREKFLMRFDEIFDSKLIAMIVNSNPSKDWSALGYQGMMLGNGSVWIDYDGTLLAVNYQSDAEARIKKELIVKDKQHLHNSLSDFETPVCVLLTKKYRIRIDAMKNGKYRYASWKFTSKMNDKPDLVIQNGKYVPDGSGGNHSYVFKNGNYLYECGIVLLGEEDSSPAYLTVYKDGKEIVSEPAAIKAN